MSIALHACVAPVFCIQFGGMSQQESMPKLGNGERRTRYLLGSLRIYLAPCRSRNSCPSLNHCPSSERFSMSCLRPGLVTLSADCTDPAMLSCWPRFLRMPHDDSSSS